ncbi:MAG TPA: GtrA family protein [Haloplasmataceae bacterium]
MFKSIEKIIEKYDLAEFIRFVIVGVIATAINYVVYRLFIQIIDKSIAYTIGYIVSFGFNLLATHLFTFNKKINALSTLGFALAHLFNYLVQVALLNIFTTYIGIPKAYAPLPVYVIAIPVNFLTVRFAIKRSKKLK